MDASVRAAYGKLERTPIPRELGLPGRVYGTARRHLPRGIPRPGPQLPKSLDEYEVVVFDGKAIKRVAKRLKPLWGAAGGLLGGRALVALDLRSGLAVAMRAHPDGDANEVRFVGDLVPEVRRLSPGKRLWVADSRSAT